MRLIVLAPVVAAAALAACWPGFQRRWFLGLELHDAAK